MLVETFEVNEVTEDGPECTEEQLKLIEELELEGQQKLISKTDEGETVIPYREMTAEEVFVYQTLNPERVKANDYEACPIPVRVLQVLSFARELNYFAGIEVWCPESETEKDPLLVGYLGDSWNPSKWFLLARWGEMLEDYKTLLKRAKEVWAEKTKIRLETIKSKIDEDIVRIKSGAFGNRGPSYKSPLRKSEWDAFEG